MNVLRGSNSWLAALLKCAVLITAAIWIYYPSIHGQALWDDNTEIFKNAWITQNALSWKIWVSSSGPDYQPLKTTLEWLLYHVSHGNLVLIHLTSLSLHLLSSFLIWKITSRFNPTSSWLAGLLFILHPLSVSSVAWIAELKNTLSLPLLLLAVDRFIENESSTTTDNKFSLSTFIYFSLSLLCKSSGVLFPGFILLYYFWKKTPITQKKIKHLLAYSITPLVLGLITLKLQISQALPTDANETKHIGEIIGSIIPLLGTYVSHFVWPFKLAPIYSNADTYIGYLVGCTYLGASLWLFLHPSRTIKTLGLFLLSAALFLLPVLGILPMSFTLISPVGDHLSYISLAFWCISTVLVLNHVSQWCRNRFHLNPLFINLTAGIPLAFILLSESHSYAKSYQSSLNLWTRATSMTPESWFCLNNLGEAQLTQNEVAHAITTLSKANKLNPKKTEILINLSEAYFQAHDLTQAINCAKASIAIEPTNASAHYNLANAQAARGDLNQAIVEYKEAETLEPLSAEFHYNHAIALSELGLINASMTEFETCIRLNPNSIEAYINLAILHASLNDWQEAGKCYSQALTLDPDQFEANYGYADTLMALNKPTEAIKYYNLALRQQPTHPGAREGLKQAQSSIISH